MDDVIARCLKTCSRCDKTKPRTAIYFGQRSGQIANICKVCHSRADKARYHANRETILASKKAARERDPDGYRVKRRAYYAKNKKHLNAIAGARIKTDPILHVRNTFRTRFVKVFRAKGLKKITSWQRLVGYSVRELKAHIEALLTPPMTWENYGSVWHIDHKRPVASFTLPEQIRECWALSNLQPLLKLENHRKGARMPVPQQEAIHV
jgi:hypothetical protein